MTIERRQKTITLSNGRSFTIHESNWKMATDRAAHEESARQEKAKQNGSGDSDTLFFMESIYPPLVSCSVGDVPTLQEAINLPADDLDDWFFAVRDLNPEWFPPADEMESDFQFRDGTTISVLSVKRPSVLMRLRQYEKQVDNAPATDQASLEVFRILYYPKMAACCVGDIPPLDVAMNDYPESELNKWYNAVRRVNPSLFLTLEEIAETNQQAVNQAEKKRQKRRKRS